MSWLNLTRNIASPKTTARRLTSLRGWAKWAGVGVVLTEYIPPRPGKSIPHPLPEGMEGVRRMIEVARNVEQEALVALGGMAGLRISESLSVTMSSVDHERMLLTVRGKGDRERTVPLSDDTWRTIMPAYVLAMNKPDKRLISYQDRFARQIVTNLGQKAKLQRHVKSHDLRATFATAILDLTGNLRLAQELLGHSSSNTTEIYTSVAINQMREAVNEL